MIKVLHVNNTDLMGRRFNGYDLIARSAPYGVECSQAVLLKQSDNPRVVPLLEGADFDIQAAIERVERKRSLNNLLFPWARSLRMLPEYQAADVVHYHLVHNNLISLADLPVLFAEKPSVWTIHDPWILTGHCIHPFTCDRWMTGCEVCPNLDFVVPLAEDNAGAMWNIKQEVLRRSDVDLIVASEFMHDMVSRSPIIHSQRVHTIPFGIDADDFLEDSERDQSRMRLGIGPDHFVIAFRSSSIPFKGTNLLHRALETIFPDRPVTLLTVDSPGRLDDLKHRYTVIELGWRTDTATMVDFFSACDIFVMPSLAEAFGLMAAEAMAAGRPVVGFADTAVESVIHAPDAGVAVRYADPDALGREILRLMANPDEVASRGIRSRAIARWEYGLDRHLSSLTTLYRDVLERHRP